MIKINLLPIKKRKKAKPLPTFAIAGVGIFIIAAAVMGYLFYFYSSRVSEKKQLVADNDRKIEELGRKIKSVEDYEKKNAEYKKQKEIIEQLGKNKIMPIRVLDEISSQLPPGVWLNNLSLNGDAVSISCTGFNNTDVVNYVNNLKGSKMFAEVYLQESVQGNQGGFAVYTFRITFKVKA